LRWVMKIMGGSAKEGATPIQPKRVSRNLKKFQRKKV